MLLTTDGARPEIRARLKLTAERSQTLSHPAIAGTALYVRVGKRLNRLDLEQN